MNMFGFAQPKKFRQMLMTEENTDDGFLPRMLMVSIPERRMPRKNIETDVASLNSLKEAFAQLEGEVPNFIGCGKKKVNPMVHHLSDEAQAYWQILEDDNDDVIEAFFQNTDHWFRPYFNKKQAHIARLALVLHMMHKTLGEDGGKVSLKTIKDAEKLTNYFLGNVYQFIKQGEKNNGPTEYAKEFSKIKRWCNKYHAPMPLLKMLKQRIFASADVRDKAVKYYVDKGFATVIKTGTDKGKLENSLYLIGKQ
jgi:hypothetical protein